MAVKEVLTYPDPRLKQEAEEITEVTDKIRAVIKDLVDTMVESGHSTGIAAPQIGELYRIVVADASRAKRECENHGLLVMLNPEIIQYSGMSKSREGCMSVPEYTGNVSRAEKVVVQYMDDELNRHVIDAEGFEAVLLQHEIDHLDGVLFIDRVISRRTDLFRRKK